MDDKLIYKGQSMRGTFSFGDRLIIEHVPLADIRPGDVVVYRNLSCKGDLDMVVHRVMDVTPFGLVVRGDHNYREDDILVIQNNLIGKVSHVERGTKKTPVLGSSSGLMIARALHGWSFFRLKMWQFIRMMGRRPYRRLQGSGLVRRWWNPSIQKILLRTANGPLIKYVYKNRTVGLSWPEKNSTRYRKPYDLVMKRRIPKKR